MKSDKFIFIEEQLQLTNLQFLNTPQIKHVFVLQMNSP